MQHSTISHGESLYGVLLRKKRQLLIHGFIRKSIDDGYFIFYIVQIIQNLENIGISVLLLLFLFISI